MTRNEFELAIYRVDPSDFNTTTKTFEIVNQYVNELEQRIAEYEEFYIHRNEAQRINNKNIDDMLKHIKKLESPNTCYTCKYYNSYELHGRVLQTCSVVGLHEYAEDNYFEDFYCSRYEPKGLTNE